MLTSIVILTYERPDILLENLKIIGKQTHDEKEIIVVDNGNSEKTKRLIEQAYPGTKYFGIPVNNPCEARNQGIKRSSGDIIVMLDDDVMFAHENALSEIVDLFRKRFDIDAVNFKIVFPDGHMIIPFNWYHPKDYRIYGETEFETDYISEGAVAFRKDVFNIAGYYHREFFMSHEGPDLAYRMIRHGLNIIYNPRIMVIHNVSKLQRPSWRNSYYDTRNQIWLGLRNLPLSWLIPHVIYRLFTTFCFSFSRRHVRWYFKAVLDGIKAIPRELKYREPLSGDAMRRLREIRKHQLNPLSRIRAFMGKLDLVKKYYN